jgi:hypothetical protein
MDKGVVIVSLALHLFFFLFKFTFGLLGVAIILITSYAYIGKCLKHCKLDFK